MDTSLIKPPTLEVSYSELMAQTIDNPKQQDPGDIFLSKPVRWYNYYLWFGKKELMTSYKKMEHKNQCFENQTEHLFLVGDGSNQFLSIYVYANF